MRITESKFNKFTILMMDIGEEKLQYKNYLKHQVQQKNGQKNDY